MNFTTGFSAAFLCGLLVVSMMICGCTSSSEKSAAGTDSLPEVSAETAAMAGTYTSVEDQVSKIVLGADGRASIVKPTGTIAGTYTVEKGEIKICVEESDGRSCLMAPVEPDGSFVLGQNTYKQ